MVKDYDLTTCGLSCDLCDSNTTKIQDAARYLLKIFEDPMFQGVLTITAPDFKPKNYSGFIDTLEVLGKYPPCPGCQERRDCVINQCTEKKGINSCSECKMLDLEAGICKEVPEFSKDSMMPPASIFFQGLSKRYKNWNVENLVAINKDQKDKIIAKIAKMINEGKTSRDLIDFSVNLFESMK